MLSVRPPGKSFYITVLARRRLSIYLFHKFYQPPQCCQPLIKRLSIRIHLQRVHTCLLVYTQALTHHFFRANEVGFEHELIWDTCHSLIALLFEPQVLNLKCNISIPCPAIYIVIKIMLSRPHSSECECESRLARSDQALRIVRECNYPSCDLKIKISESFPHMLCTFSDWTKKYGGMFRYKRCPEPAVAGNRIQLSQLDILII
jgi:hypothetical protein